MKKYVNRLTLGELKALTWYHTCLSIGTANQATHVINPASYKSKQGLADHLTNVVGILEVDTEKLEEYIAAWTRVKDTTTEQLATLIKNAARASEPGVAVSNVPLGEAIMIPAVQAPVAPQVPIQSVAQISASVSSSTPVVTSAISDRNVYEIKDDDTRTTSTSSNRNTKGVDLIDKWTPYGEVKIEDWMKKIELIKKMWSWTDTQAIDAIQLKLTDPHAFNNLSDFIKMKTTPSHQVRLSEVKDYMINLYQSVISTSIVRSQLYSCKQNVLGGETVTDYSKRFRTILMKLSTVEEAEKVDMYLHGLDVRLKQDVLYNLNRPNTTKSLGTAERLAQEAEIQRKEKEEQELLLTQQQRSHYQHPEHSRYIYKNFNNSKRGKAGHGIGTTARSMTSLAAATPVNAINQVPRTCWTCGATGHLSSQCYHNPLNGANPNPTPTPNPTPDPSNTRTPVAFARRGGRGGSASSNRGGHGPAKPLAQ
jgi:hypothetical protein